jgi:hypothetical protein
MTDCCAFYRGKVAFGATAGSLRELGNASRLAFYPVEDDLLPLDASLNSSCCGWVGCRVELTLSCTDWHNVRMAFGSSITTSGDSVIHNMGQQCNGRGTLRFNGENAFGGLIAIDVPELEFRNADVLNLISSEVEQYTLRGRVIPQGYTWFTMTTTAVAGDCGDPPPPPPEEESWHFSYLTGTCVQGGFVVSPTPTYPTQAACNAANAGVMTQWVYDPATQSCVVQTT